MPRKWTRDERRKHLRESYYGWKEKAFVMIVSLLVIFLFLYISVFWTPSIQGISAGAIIVMGIIFFLVTFAGADYKKLTLAFVGLLIVLIIAAGIILIGTLGPVERIAASIILGLIFLLLVAVVAFFIDMYTYESG